MLKKIIKFIITGCLGTLTNLFVFFVLQTLLSFNAFASSCLAFFVAATQNYIINHIWTFKTQAQQGLCLFLWAKYLLLNILGQIVSLIMLKVLIASFSWKYLVIPQAYSIIIGMVCNFICVNFLVFSKKNNNKR